MTTARNRTLGPASLATNAYRRFTNMTPRVTFAKQHFTPTADGIGWLEFHHSVETPTATPVEGRRGEDRPVRHGSVVENGSEAEAEEEVSAASSIGLTPPNSFPSAWSRL